MKVYCIVYKYTGELVSIHSTKTGAREALSERAEAGNLWAKGQVVEEWEVEELDE